jgi:eukaryotic-like serine/threonine-protein kinase
MKSHEHVLVIKLEDIVKDQNNHPYIIMEKYDSSLNDYMKGRSLEESEIRRIFAMICIALFYIHNKGIIHRDMKPHNILMKKIGDQTVYVITDFGIAKNSNI